jgi:hypothetical protein
MLNQTYALLIGINQYDPTSFIPSLEGCTNDVQAMQAYLQGRVAQDNGNLHLKTLLNEQATRQAVIDGFRNHLCQAGPDDVALFSMPVTVLKKTLPKNSGPSNPTTWTKPSSATTAAPMAVGTWPTKNWPNLSPKWPKRIPTS